MKYASLFVLVLVAPGCSDDPTPPPSNSTDSDSSFTTGSGTTSTSGSATSNRSNASNTTSSTTTSTGGGSNVTTQPSGTTTGTGTAPTSGTSAGTSGGNNTSDVSEIPDCEVVVNFDSAWGVVATGGGSNPEAWETSVTPSVADGVFSVEIPFTTSAQQFGWNGDYPEGPVDCTGRELVARMRLRSGFVEDPESAPGGIQMYLFSNEWANSVTAWNNVPAPSDDWFEASVGCESVEDSAFDPTLVNGIGFTFNSGGADSAAYAATTAAFEVDQLCWRGSAETSDAGATSAEADAGSEVTSGATDPDADAGVSSEDPDASVLPTDAGDESSTTSATVTSSTTSSSASTTATSASTATDAGTPDDCEMLIDFDSPWGVVASGGGTVPEEWETDVDPTVADGIFSVTVPFSTSAQQYGWVGDHPDGVVDCTGWELVARVRLTSGFVENPETQAGGVQVYLFSDSWAEGINTWNVVPAASDDWFEATVSCETVLDSDFDPETLNAVGFTFNSGGDEDEYESDTAEFEVDYLCWRK